MNDDNNYMKDMSPNDDDQSKTEDTGTEQQTGELGGEATEDTDMNDYDAGSDTGSGE